MRLSEFDMVRMQCAYEGKVERDLSGSGVPSLSLRDVLSGDEVNDLCLDVPQGYPPVGGSVALKERIAGLYGGAEPDNVHVTNGATEANFMAAWRLLEEGDELVVVVPGYVQTANLAKSWGVKVKPLPLRESLGWQFDLEYLKEVVSERTKAIQLCNPNNPTGAVMAPEQRRALVDAARDVGAWILCDEVYIGSELDGTETESLWNGYERLLVTNGLCKSYGLPGLRIGWLMGAPEVLQEIVSRRDYVTLTHTALSDRIAQLVLERDTRERVLDLNREVVRAGVGIIRDWCSERSPAFSYLPPVAGPMCFMRYGPKLSSTTVADHLREEKSVLVVPGEMMGMDGYLRIGLGLQKDYLTDSLERIDALLQSLEGG